MRSHGIIVCLAGLTFGLACSGLPPVSSAPPADVRSVQATSDLPASTRRSACADATRRARRAARGECEVTSLSSTHALCECTRADQGSRAWHCSSTALYTCQPRH